MSHHSPTPPSDPTPPPQPPPSDPTPPPETPPSDPTPSPETLPPSGPTPPPETPPPSDPTLPTQTPPSDSIPPPQPPPSDPIPPPPDSTPPPQTPPPLDPTPPPQSPLSDSTPPPPPSDPASPLPTTSEQPQQTPPTTTELDTPQPETATTTTTSSQKDGTFIQPADSFKEESNLLSHLTQLQLTSLSNLKTLLTQSNPSHHQLSIWGVPLFKDDRTDTILLKFLRARDFKVHESFQMINNTLNWRTQFGVDSLLEEDICGDLDKVVFMHGFDKEGHPVCYNVYGEFQNKDLYDKTFSTEEKRERFVRWRIQFLERSIRKLDFRPGGINTIFQVNDFKNAPGPGKRELRQATKQALQLLQDNYPEFVAKQVFINVPWWYVAFYTMMSPFMTQRTKSKFVFAGPSKTAETLFKYISPEQVPIPYGGLSVDYCECNPDFTDDDPAIDRSLKSATKQFVEIICSEKCVIVWELRVVGWEVTYGAEFVPSAKDGYTVVIHKATKMSPTDDPVVSGTFKVGEVGKIVLSVDNPTFKKKKLLYRYKELPYSD